MTQTIAGQRAEIAELKRGVAAAANDPPQHGYKLMMSAEDIAAIRGCDADTVRDKHRSWTEKNGFPKPIPGMAPLVWSGPQFMNWLRGEVTITGGPLLAIDLTRDGGANPLELKYGSGR